MDFLAIIDPARQACGLVADDPTILLSWLRTLTHEISADAFLAIVKTQTDDPGNIAQMKELVTNCIGNPA